MSNLREKATPRRVSDIDWPNWVPEQRATLLFVIKDGRILLIYKKRGLGAGNINGPGGRLEPGETPLEAAVRETHEEICITPLHVRERGELFFQFVDGLTIHCVVFSATDFEGAPGETDEASPLWVDCDAIPYDRMWEDDRYWLPLLLDGRQFRGYFTFDGPKMLDHQLESWDGMK